MSTTSPAQMGLALALVLALPSPVAACQCGGPADAALGLERADTVVAGGRAEGAQHVRRGLADHLRPALRRGGALLLLDGLDELPVSAEGGGASPRARVARAVAVLARDVPGATIVVLGLARAGVRATPQVKHIRLAATFAVPRPH